MNTAFLQAGLLAATIALYAVCLTTHNTSRVVLNTLYTLTVSTFVSFVCVRWIPSMVYTMLGITFFLLTINATTVAYLNFWQPITNKPKIGLKLVYGLAAFGLFVLILWTFDNHKTQQVEQAIEHVTGKVDTIAAVQGANVQKLTRLDTTVSKLAKTDTVLTKTVQQTKDELWQKVDDNGNQVTDKLQDLSLQQHRMNTTLQKRTKK